MREIVMRAADLMVGVAVVAAIMVMTIHAFRNRGDF